MISVAQNGEYVYFICIVAGLPVCEFEYVCCVCVTEKAREEDREEEKERERMRLRARERETERETERERKRERERKNCISTVAAWPVCGFEWVCFNT